MIMFFGGGGFNTEEKVYYSDGRFEILILMGSRSFRSDKKYCNFKELLQNLLVNTSKARKNGGGKSELTEAIEDSVKEDHTSHVWSAPLSP